MASIPPASKPRPAAWHFQISLTDWEKAKTISNNSYKRISINNKLYRNRGTFIVLNGLFVDSQEESKKQEKQTKSLTCPRTLVGRFSWPRVGHPTTTQWNTFLYVATQRYRIYFSLPCVTSRADNKCNKQLFPHFQIHHRPEHIFKGLQNHDDQRRVLHGYDNKFSVCS